MSTINRLIILTVTVVTVWGIALMLRGTLSTESLPDWRLSEFPMDLRQDAPDGSETLWLGEDHEVDPILTQAMDADEWIDRRYVDGVGNVVTVHVAAFKQYQFGVAHNPMVCYGRGGWTRKPRDASELGLDVAGNKDESKDKTKVVHVKVAAWEHEEYGRAVIAYWYQLGDDLVFDRWSLGAARMKWFGKPFQPALIKVLMHTTYTTSSDEELAQARLKAMGEHVYDWINLPDHDWVPQQKPQ